MADWQPMRLAPRDGTRIQADIPGHGVDNIIAWFGGLMNEDNEDCGGWHYMEDREPPDSWTDGICWARNEDGVPSVKPTRWKHLPKLPAERPEKPADAP